ncbi:MAG: dihydrolipoyl dehydrogenase [Myxococcales bacterium]|nr:dihydrolipoyl dehydrogenase [Myxococcales bacterium]
MERYDLVVIGGGPGGYVCAIRAAQLGLRVALVEKRPTLGGTCLNIGCIPSKALLESSELYSVARHKLERHGIAVSGLSLELATMLARKDKVVSELTSGLDLLMKKNKIERLRGSGRLLDANTVRVDLNDAEAVNLGAEAIVLATGSVPVELPFLRFDGETIVSSTEALSFDRVPKRLLVIGAGAIGLEMGSVWSRLGSAVTVVELLDRIAPLSDAEMSAALQRVLQRQGLTFKLEHKVTGASVNDGVATLRFENKKGEAGEIEGEKVLVAVGRRAYSEGLALDSVGLKTERNGKLAVDAGLRTAVPSIYAIGDLIDGPMLAHKAEEEGVAVAEALAAGAGHVNYEAIPNVIYTHPELAEVGLSEAAAKEKGFEVRVGTYMFRANGRAKTLDDVDGVVKLVACARTDRLLGAHIVGPRASDLIPELVLALEFKASAEDVARTVHAHPTLSEAIKEAALAVGGSPIHG